MPPVKSRLHCQFLSHVSKVLFFTKIALKWSYFCKKMQNFRALGAPPPDLRASGGSCGLRPQTPKIAPSLRISGYAPGSRKGNVLLVCCRPATNSGQKIGLNLSEDFFSFSFFNLQLILGKKLDWIWVEQFLIFIFVLLKFSEVHGPPFSKSCVRYYAVLKL